MHSPHVPTIKETTIGASAPKRPSSARRAVGGSLSQFAYLTPESVANHRNRCSKELGYLFPVKAGPSERQYCAAPFAELAYDSLQIKPRINLTTPTVVSRAVGKVA